MPVKSRCSEKNKKLSVPSRDCTIIRYERQTDEGLRVDHGYRFMCPLCKTIEIKYLAEKNVGQLGEVGISTQIVRITDDPDAISRGWYNGSLEIDEVLDFRFDDTQLTPEWFQAATKVLFPAGLPETLAKNP